MNALRRAVGRKEVLLALFLVLSAGGWIGWSLWAQSGVTAPPGPGLSTLIDQAKSFLDAGDYAQALTRLNSLGAAGNQPAALKYKALVQLLTGEMASVLQTADTVMSHSVTGSDASLAAGVKALTLLHDEHLQVAQAKQAAELAVQQAGEDSEALLVAKIAQAAVLRSELDLPGQTLNVLQQTAQIRQMLSPFVEQSPEPQSAWRRHFWRRGLATLTDAGILASEAGDAAGETQALTLLQRCCPQETWACHFTIPAKALAAAQAGTLDDHARLAMYTVAGYLYTQTGDRIRCDALFQRAIRLYGRLLEDYDGWEGNQVPTSTPKGKIKNVGIEFYDYKDRQLRLARYSADWWGIRAVRGEVPLADAMKACDCWLFHAIVRVRADRNANPITILQEEALRPLDYQAVADWFQAQPYPPQSDWERQRAAEIVKVGRERCRLKYEDIPRVNTLREQQNWVGAAEVMEKLVQDGLTVPQDRAYALISAANSRERAGHRDVAEALLRRALTDIQAESPYRNDYTRQRTQDVQYRLSMLLLRAGKTDDGCAVAEQLLQDSQVSDRRKMGTLHQLTVAYAHSRRAEEAASALARLQELRIQDPKEQPLWENLVADAERVFARHLAPPADFGTSASQPVNRTLP